MWSGFLCSLTSSFFVRIKCHDSVSPSGFLEIKLCNPAHTDQYDHKLYLDCDTFRVLFMITW